MAIANPSENPTILVVLPQPGRREQLKHDLPAYRWVEAPADWPHRPGDPPVTPDVIMVDAEGKTDDRVLQACKTLRETRQFENTPILVSISMYRMDLGNRVKKLPGTDIVIRPIEEADLTRQLATRP